MNTVGDCTPCGLGTTFPTWVLWRAAAGEGSEDVQEENRGKEGEQEEAAHTDPCTVYFFLCDGRAPGYRPLITSDGDNTAPAVSRTDCHTLKQHWPGKEPR